MTKKSPRRSALGRGLGALLPETPTRARGTGTPTPGALRELPLDAIAPNPEQPRRVFDEAELDALAASIRRHGVLQPVVVRQTPGGARAKTEWQLVVGERRFRACQRAGRKRIPALVREQASAELLEVALLENVQRQDLNPVELAHAFRTLCDGGLTQAKVGARVGLERSTVTNHLRLLELAPALQQDVERGALSLGHAKALLTAGARAAQLRLRNRVVRDGLSVRATEQAARSLRGGVGTRAKKPRGGGGGDANQRALVRGLEDRLQTRVRIHGDGRKGRIEITFASPAELGRIHASILE